MVCFLDACKKRKAAIKLIKQEVEGEVINFIPLATTQEKANALAIIYGANLMFRASDKFNNQTDLKFCCTRNTLEEATEAEEPHIFNSLDYDHEQFNENDQFPNSLFIDMPTFHQIYLHSKSEEEGQPKYPFLKKAIFNIRREKIDDYIKTTIKERNKNGGGGKKKTRKRKKIRKRKNIFKRTKKRKKKRKKRHIKKKIKRRRRTKKR
jgi:hypothetical protein